MDSNLTPPKSPPAPEFQFDEKNQKTYEKKLKPEIKLEEDDDVKIICTICFNDPMISCKVCACSICGGKEYPEKQLICDQCENYFHMTCIDPALEDIPDGDWFCSDCKILGKIYKGENI